MSFLDSVLGDRSLKAAPELFKLKKSQQEMPVIVAPLSIRDDDKLVVRYAVDIAKQQGLPVLLHYSYHGHTVSAESLSSYKNNLFNIEKKVVEYLRSLMNPYEKEIYGCGSSEGKVIDFEWSYSQGELVTDIKRIAKQKSIHTVAVMEGYTSYSQIAQSTTCTQLIIPKNTTYRSFDNITYVANLNQEDNEIITDLVTFTKRFTANINCLCINTNPKKLAQETEELKFIEHETKKAINSDSMAFFVRQDTGFQTGVKRFLDEHKSNLLIMRLKATNFFSDLFQKSKPERIASELKTPILLV